MDGSNDVRPEVARPASDPSLEDMLRRARAAHLGSNLESHAQHQQRIQPRITPERAAGTAPWFRGRAAFSAGVLVGILLAYLVAQAGATISSVFAPVQPAAQTAPPVATLAPAPTDTPVPTPTDGPTATPALATPPLTTDEIVALAQDYYDQLGPFAGQYVLMDGPTVQIQSASDTQLTACIAYDYASIAAPDAVAGSDTRLFTLAPGSDGTWQVVQMGDASSCSLS